MEKLPYTKEMLEEAVKDCYSFNQLLLKTGRAANSGGNNTYIKKKLDEYKIDYSHFTGQSWRKGLTQETDSRIQSSAKHTDETIFVENSTVGRNTVRAYILRNNKIQYVCQLCNNTGEWLGKEMPLHLDHINGVNKDHRLENLRFVCPNCHATMDTYAGKNNR